MISMKKYQQWVETQIYSKHLNKLFSISQRADKHFKSVPFPKKSKSAYNKKGQKSISYFNGNKSSKQTLTFHQLSQENYRLMNRIVKTKPVVDHTQQSKSYNKSRIIYNKMLKKRVQNSLKERNFTEFINKSKMHHQFNLNRFKYFIKIRLINSSILLLKNSFSEVWFELVSDFSKATSEKINTEQMHGHSFCFSFSKKFKINNLAKLTMYYSGGLDVKIIGIFKLIIPEFYCPAMIELESIQKNNIKIEAQITSIYLDKFLQN